MSAFREAKKLLSLAVSVPPSLHSAAQPLTRVKYQFILSTKGAFSALS